MQPVELKITVPVIFLANKLYRVLHMPVLTIVVNG